MLIKRHRKKKKSQIANNNYLELSLIPSSPNQPAPWHIPPGTDGQTDRPDVFLFVLLRNLPPKSKKITEDKKPTSQCEAGYMLLPSLLANFFHHLRGRVLGVFRSV